MYHMLTRLPAAAAMDRYVNVPVMSSEPRVVPIPCPFGLTIVEPALNNAGVSLKDVRDGVTLAMPGHLVARTAARG
jgi:hypothetical protein